MEVENFFTGLKKLDPVLTTVVSKLRRSYVAKCIGNPYIIKNGLFFHAGHIFETLDSRFDPKKIMYLQKHGIQENVWGIFEFLIFGRFLEDFMSFLGHFGSEGPKLDLKPPEIGQKSKFQKSPTHFRRYHVFEGT